MKGFSKYHFLIIWCSNKKGEVTRTVYEEWFTKYFCPAVKKYRINNNLENKTLLILDSDPGHSPNLDDLTDNAQIIFLPPDTTSNN